MLRFISYDIVFQEIPGEVTLAINISNCPNRCFGCHSPHLIEDKGEVLDENIILGLLEKYGNVISCICFMGGDASPFEIQKLVQYIKLKQDRPIKTAWYSGKKDVPPNFSLEYFDYIKLGPYIQKKGGLNSKNTNQRFYRIKEGKKIDMTGLFLK